MLYHTDEAEGKTFRSKEIIADFFIKVKAVNEYIQKDGKTQRKYVLEFYNPEYVGNAEIDSKQLEKFDYSSIDDILQLSPTIPTAGKEMAYFIKSQTKGITSNRICLFDKLGWHNVNNNHVYCAGNILLGSCQYNYKIAEELSDKYKFEYDSSLTEQEAVKHMFDMMNVEPQIIPIVFITGMLGILRQLFKDADIKVPCCLYVFGPSQSRKTTVVIFCTALYGRSFLQDLSGVSTLRVSSTEFKSEECVDALKDATFVFDDLYKETDKKLYKDYEKRVRNIIRNFADNSPRTTARSSFENNCQVIITAEYMLNTKTDVGRLMLLNVDKPIDSQKLSACQEHPLSVSTFYYHFIKWLSDKYAEIVLDIKQQFKAFRISAFSHQFGYERLYEQSFLLNYAYGLFLKYAAEIGYNIRNKETVESEFCTFVNKALSKQKTIIEKLETSEIDEINFSSELVSMIKDKTIVLGEKGSICFKKDNMIYISNEYLCKMLYQKYNKRFTEKNIAAYFRDRFISQVYADNRSKRYDNKRYLVLNINELNNDAKDDTHTINNLFFK